jgi:hypothetical protein
VGGGGRASSENNPDTKKKPEGDNNGGGSSRAETLARLTGEYGVSLGSRIDEAPDESIGAIARGIESVMDDFPRLKGKVELFYDPEYNAGAYAPGYWGEDGYLNHQIAMAISFSPDRIGRSLNNYYEFSNVGGEVAMNFAEGAGAHEAGHVVMHELANAIYGSKVTSSAFARSGAISDALNEHRVEKRIVNAAYKRVVGQGETRSLSELRHDLRVDDYGAKNMAETVAVAFGQVKSLRSGAQPFAKAIYDVAKEYAKKYFT